MRIIVFLRGGSGFVVLQRLKNYTTVRYEDVISVANAFT